jgi:hypothetical protein
MVLYFSAGYGIEFEAIQQWATRNCDSHNEDPAVVFSHFSRAVRQKEAEVIPIDYSEDGQDQGCLVLLITHNGTLAAGGGFRVKTNGEVERKAGLAERLAKRWLLAEGFQTSDFQLVTVKTTDWHF